MKYIYRYELEDCLNHHRLLHPEGFRKWRDQYLNSLFYPVMFGAAAVGFAWNTSLYFSCLLISAVGWYAWSLFPFKRKYDLEVMRICQPSQENAIRLDVCEKGMTETIKGIESFCPWSSILGYYLFNETAFIEMENSLWAVVPKHTLHESSDEFDELISTLDANHIPRKQNQAAAAFSDAS